MSQYLLFIAWPTLGDKAPRAALTSTNSTMLSKVGLCRQARAERHPSVNAIAKMREARNA